MPKLSTLGQISHLPVYAARSLEQRPDFVTLTIMINHNKDRKSRTFVFQIWKLRPRGLVLGKQLLCDLQRNGEMMLASKYVFRAWFKIEECKTSSSLQSPQVLTCHEHGAAWSSTGSWEGILSGVTKMHTGRDRHNHGL